MLVLTRKNRESVVIGQPGEMQIALEITILEIEGGRVRLGFAADNKLPIHRREVWDRICNGQGNGQGNGDGNGHANGDSIAASQPLAAAQARIEGRRQADG
jgi:carbon storage regulator CsrA